MLNAVFYLVNKLGRFSTLPPARVQLNVGSSKLSKAIFIGPIELNGPSYGRRPRHFDRRPAKPPRSISASLMWIRAARSKSPPLNSLPKRGRSPQLCRRTLVHVAATILSE